MGSIWMSRDPHFAKCLRLVGGVWEVNPAEIDAWQKQHAAYVLAERQREDAALQGRIAKSRRMW